jgi:hypothetical protein
MASSDVRFSEPKFQLGDRVHVVSIKSRRFEGEIVDRHEDDNEWFYSIDRRNYLHETMLELISSSEATNDPTQPKLHRFDVGDSVWVRDRGTHGGFRIVMAKVREQHTHPERHPGYPNGEGYALDGDLWWDCYPGCRVFATKEQAKAAKIGGHK